MSHHSQDSITDIGHTMEKLAVNTIVQTEPGSYVHETEVTRSDILSGRGNGVAGHEGNQLYLRLIKDHQKEYQGLSSPKKKKQVALKVMDIVKGLDPPGRFLKSLKSEAFMWTVQDDQAAMKKVAQALREKPKKGRGQKEPKAAGVENAPQETRLLKSLLGTRKRGDDRAETSSPRRPSLLGNPAKKSIVGSSRRVMAKWFKSISKLKLSSTSLGEMYIDDGPPQNEDVLLAMHQLSGSGTDELEIPTPITDIGEKLDVLLSQAARMPIIDKNLLENDGKADCDERSMMQEDFIALMETSVRSLFNGSNSSKRTLQKGLSGLSLQNAVDEMNQAVEDEIHRLRQETDRGLLSPTCISSKSLLTGNISLMSGNMEEFGVEESEEKELRDAWRQLLATDSIQSSMGKLDISSKQVGV